MSMHAKVKVEGIIHESYKKKVGMMMRGVTLNEQRKDSNSIVRRVKEKRAINSAVRTDGKGMQLESYTSEGERQETGVK